MDHIRILKRAFFITRDYRALWVFGVLLAITTASGNGGVNGGGGDGGGGGDFPGTSWPTISPEMITALIVAGIIVLILILVLGVLFTIARYVSETALIRMVEGYEANGEKVSVRQGFRLGWSRAALRLFLMDLLIGLTVIISLLLLLLIAAAPLLVWFIDSLPARVFGSALSIAMAVLIIFAAIVVGIVLSLLLQFFHRAAVLEEKGVMDAMRRGWQLASQRIGDVIVMGLILFGLGLAWVIVSIPLLIVLFMAAVIVGGLPALFAGLIAGLFAGDVIPWIVAGVVGFPIFFLVIAVPTLFLNGLVETFLSSTWTLTYRELLALEAARPRPAPAGPPEGEAAAPA